MYYEYDLLTPVVSEFVLNSKAKNLILDNWPTTTVDGVEVFSRMYLAHSEQFIEPATVGKEQLMKTLGMDIDTLRDQSWKGVSNAWVSLEHRDIDSTAISNLDVYREITRSSTVDNRYEEQTAYFEVVTANAPMSSSAKTQLYSDFANGVNLKVYPHEYVEGEQPTWHIAFADVSGQIYNRRFIVHSPTITREGGNTFYNTVIELKYSIKEYEADGKTKYVLPLPVDCDALLNRIKANDVWPKEYEDMQFGTNVNDSTLYITHKTPKAWVEPVNPGDTTVLGEIADNNGYGPSDYKYEYWLRKDGVAALKLKAFAKLIGSALTFDYSKKKSPWWVKVVTAVIIIVVIIIAVIITVATGGVAGPTGWALVAAVAGIVSITATVIVVALSMYAGMLGRMGDASGVGMIGNVVVVVTEIGKIAGYVSILSGGIVAYQNFSNMTTTQILTQSLNFTNLAVNLYKEDKVNRDKKKIDELQRKTDDIERLEDEYYSDEEVNYSSPKAIEAAQEAFYRNIDMDLYGSIDKVYYMATTGNVNLATHKYY